MKKNNVELLVVDNHDQKPINKHFYKDNGRIHKHVFGDLHQGTATPHKIPLSKIASFFDNLKPYQAIVAGRLKSNVAYEGDQVNIITKRKLNGQKNTIARSQEFIEHSNLTYIDHDPRKEGNAFPHPEAVSPEKLLKILEGIFPGFHECGKIIRHSSSSGIYDGDEQVTGNNSYHVYLAVNSPKDVSRLKDILKHRLALAGYAYILFGKDGSMNERVILDLSVYTPERLIFASPPTVDEANGLIRKIPKPEVYKGPAFDIKSLANPTDDEREEVRRIFAKLKNDPQCIEMSDSRREKTVKTYAPKIANACKITVEQAKDNLRKTYASTSKTLDLPHDAYVFTKKGTMTVKDILDNPKKFDGVSCADPAEPFTEQGHLDTSKGKIYTNPDRGKQKIVINSFLHGGRVFFLKRSPIDDFEDSVNEPNKSEITKVTEIDFNKLTEKKVKPNEVAKLTEIPEDIRDKLLFKICARMFDLGNTKEEVSIILDQLNVRCTSSLEKKELSSIANSAQTTVAKKKQNHKIFMKKFNERHAVVMLGGKLSIMNKVIDPVFNRPNVTFSKKSDLIGAYANKKIPNPENSKKYKNAAEVWFESPHREEYKGIVFSPKKDLEGYYNLWQGFAVTPKKGDWSLYHNHIEDVIANGDKSIAEWIIAWMARIVQDPGGKRPGTSIVLRGKQGTGKGVFVNGFGSLFGNHFLQLTHAGQVTGRFNSHLKDVLVVFVDEGFWGGNKQAEGIIKAMVTEDILNIEPKYQDIFRVKNNVNLLIASNNEWVVPAGMEERRFFVLEMPDTHLQDQKYFKAIVEQMDNGGREAMLFDLMQRDISNVNLKKFKRTDALLDQIMHSENSLKKWWFERLINSDVTKNGREWGTIVTVEEQYDDYVRFANTIGDKYPLTPQLFGSELKKLCPGVKKTKKRFNDFGSKSAVRKNAYKFPRIKECRQKFESLLKMTIAWDDPML